MKHDVLYMNDAIFLRKVKILNQITRNGLKILLNQNQIWAQHKHS